MGADLYWEERNFKPRPNKAEWDGNDLLIYKDVFYHGWTLFWRGPVTKDNESLIKVMVNKIPPKPRVFHRHELLDTVQNKFGAMDYAMSLNAQRTAVDTTLDYVVELLKDRKEIEAAKFVAELKK